MQQINQKQNKTQFQNVTDNTLQLVTIEFSVDSEIAGKFSYPHPRFTFKDRVVIASELDYYVNSNLDLSEIEILEINAIELVERIDRGKLISQPYWQYGLRSQSGTQEIMWFKEKELARYQAEKPEL